MKLRNVENCIKFYNKLYEVINGKLILVCLIKLLVFFIIFKFIKIYCYDVYVCFGYG